MTPKENPKIVVAPVASGPSRLELFLCATTALALVACALLAVYAHNLSGRMNALRENTRLEFAKVGDQLSLNADRAAKRTEAVAREAQASATTLQGIAQSEVRKTKAALSAKLEAQSAAAEADRAEMGGRLDDLKEANSTTSSRLDSINGDVTTVKSDVDTTRSDLQTTNNELKRVTGDMGVISGLIATNSKDLQTLRQLGDREYVEFDLKRGSGVQKVGGIQLALTRADAKRNRYTMDVLADDKRVEKRDRTINEPVQLYVAGNRQPVEIVVNQVKKDEVMGYVALPKVKAARP